MAAAPKLLSIGFVDIQTK